MKAKLLVTHLNKLINDNNNNEFIDIINRMKIVSLPNQIVARDELSYLINNYEMSGVEIGKLTFFGKYKIINEYYFFGNMDMDLVGFDINNREILIADHDNSNFVMMNCAKNSEAFLDVLYLYINYIFKSFSKKEILKSEDIEEIYKIAGGLKYKKFIDFLFS
jgi:hypothetical protein